MDQHAAAHGDGVYPRERGGTHPNYHRDYQRKGLSPRTRGNPIGRRLGGRSGGSIPANAGEPSWASSVERPTRVYPRERGGTDLAEVAGARPRGLSPRTRGNHMPQSARGGSAGSIPANAGEPLAAVRRRPELEVYPRERGGTRCGERASGLDPGLSPRTRGNREVDGLAQALGGSIPANAGEPSSGRRRPFSSRVYPRERGGTTRLRWRRLSMWGLSPRTRGNRRSVRQCLHCPGSIPANAGEPVVERFQRDALRVYPRERGGTADVSMDWEGSRGLSPRTRGNLGRGVGGRVGVGSIPANAGEPSWRAAFRGRTRVYPRERGGTALPCARTHSITGLSPRTRGNPGGDFAGLDLSGSIPANAGEPARARRPTWPRAVYPRERGGTGNLFDDNPNTGGLSPRTRGNRCAFAVALPPTGSIPANAGEPKSNCAPSPPCAVYPRERGGTLSDTVPPPGDSGLSPRTRGNRPDLRLQSGRRGSIPANAGEPARARRPTWPRAVYPRERGGTQD